MKTLRQVYELGKRQFHVQFEFFSVLEKVANSHTFGANIDLIQSC